LTRACILARKVSRFSAGFAFQCGEEILVSICKRQPLRKLVCYYTPKELCLRHAVHR
jgi:hypothetical protein